MERARRCRLERMEARREVEEAIGIEIAGRCAYLGLI